MVILLKGAVGSSAYGYDGPNSDIDYMSVHVNSLDYYFTPKNYLTDDVYASFKKVEGNDHTSYEFIKFVEMCQKSNPNALPLLFLKSYDVLTPLGKQLVDMRHMFLSDQTVPRQKHLAKSIFYELEKKLLSPVDKFSDDQLKKAAIMAIRPQYCAFQLAFMQTLKPEYFGFITGKKLRFSSEPFNFQQFVDYFELVGKMTDDYYLSSPLKDKKLDYRALADFYKKLLASALKSELQLCMR